MAQELECNCKWHFEKQSPASQDVGPNDAASSHFNTSPYPSLIRESIQNSLDAVADKTQPVRVVFKFRRIQASGFKEFFKLKDHINGVIELYKEKAATEYEKMLKMFEDKKNFQTVLHYICVSDYNTKGMDFNEGDVDSKFYAFLRSVGVTSKDDAFSGGSYGFGKAAYFLISPIHTVLVSTMTENGETYFEGASRLCTHYYCDENGKKVKYQHYGYYDNQKGERPASIQTDIPSRFYRNEPGTDICIMGVDGSENARKNATTEMIKAVLRHFWMAILQEKLVVEIDETIINANALDNLMKEYFHNPIDKSRNKNDINYNPRPYYDCYINQGKSDDFCCKTRSIPTIGEVYLYVWKNKDAKDSVIHMRKQLMFINRSRSYTTGYGYYAIFVCLDEKGNAFLKSVEDPSHRIWKARENDIRSADILKGIETFITESIEEVFSSENVGPLTITGLEQYLYIPEELLISDKDSVEDNPFFGSSDGATQEQGTSPLSEITSEKPTYTPLKKDSVGKVVITTTQGAERSTANPKLGGHTKNKTKNKKKGKGNHPNNYGFNPNEDTLKGKFLEQIPVRYRVMAEEIDGKVVHTILVKSDNDVECGQIEIIVGGEDMDESIAIVSSNQGEPSGNIVKNLHLLGGQNNEITLCFEDNMKHAIKLTAYELK